MKRIRTVRDVVDWGLCVGCGVCAYVCPNGALSVVNVDRVGLRPRTKSSSCRLCSECLPVCPGIGFDARTTGSGHDIPAIANPLFGSTMGIFEGFATDPEIRWAGSSGGVLTALSLFCIEKENMGFVLHTGNSAADPMCNEPGISCSRADLLTRTGSRYAPAAPCLKLDAVEKSDRPCVVIGKPCDAEALAMTVRQRPGLSSRIGLLLAFFCAGTPSTYGTRRLLAELGVNPADVRNLRYRGNGWPGEFTAAHGDAGAKASMSYQQSWEFLQKYRPFRCHLCPDGLGCAADISCGDAWHHLSGNGDPGRSLMLVRTPRGLAILQRAAKAGYVTLERASVEDVLAAQKSLLGRVQELFGRFMAMQMLLTPYPRFQGFALGRNWLALPISAKAKTFGGTLRRLITRGLWRKHSPFD